MKKGRSLPSPHPLKAPTSQCPYPFKTMTLVRFRLMSIIVYLVPYSWVRFPTQAIFQFKEIPGTSSFNILIQEDAQGLPFTDVNVKLF